MKQDLAIIAKEDTSGRRSGVIRIEGLLSVILQELGLDSPRCVYVYVCLIVCHFLSQLLGTDCQRSVPKHPETTDVG